MLKHKKPAQDIYTQVVIVPKAKGAVAIGPFQYPAEADAHARAIRLEDYTLLVVVPPRARLRVV
jgi:hypothetical protein